MISLSDFEHCLCRKCSLPFVRPVGSRKGICSSCEHLLWPCRPRLRARIAWSYNGVFNFHDFSVIQRVGKMTGESKS